MTPFWLGVLVGAVLGVNFAVLMLGLCHAARKGNMTLPTFVGIGELPDTFEIRLSATEMITLGELRSIVKER